MDFEAASLLSHEIEDEYPSLVVAGFRRLRREARADDWGLDVINLATGRMGTVDEKDLWRERLAPIANDTTSPVHEAA